MRVRLRRAAGWVLTTGVVLAVSPTWANEVLPSDEVSALPAHEETPPAKPVPIAETEAAVPPAPESSEPDPPPGGRSAWHDIGVGVAIAVSAPLVLGALGWGGRRFRVIRKQRKEASAEFDSEGRRRSNFIESGVFENPDFVGREDVLDQLHLKLTEGSVAIAQAVTGLGGVGKTEVAKSYAFRHRDDYDGVWWIDASAATIQVSAERLARALELELAPSADFDAIGAALRERLSTGTHLLVLDNLDEPDHIELFQLMGGSRVLITTRRALLPRHMVASMDLNVLDRRDSKEILRRARPDIEGDEAESLLDQIAEWLGDHALALAFASEYLRAYPDVGLAELREKLEQSDIGDEDSLFEGMSEIQVGAHSRLSVAQSLGLYLPRFEGTDAMKALAVVAYCQPDEIPVDLVAHAAKLRMDAVRKCLRELANVSVLKYGKRLSIHRLTQLAIRAHLAPRERDRAQKALRHTLIERALEFSQYIDLPEEDRAYAAQANQTMMFLLRSGAPAPAEEVRELAGLARSAPRDLRLAVLEGASAGRVYHLEHETSLVGRGDFCDVQLPDPTVSRKHAELTWRGSEIAIADMGSTSGVLVNRERVAGVRTLQPGDQIQLGLVLLELQRGSLDVPPVSAGAAPATSLRTVMEQRLERDRRVEEEFSVEGTFVDIDVVGSSAMKAEADRSTADIVLSFERFRAFVEGVINEFGGHFSSTNGDELMCFFESTLDAVRSGSAILQRLDAFNEQQNVLSSPFRFRIGIHTGRSLVDGERGVAYSAVLDVAGHLQKAASTLR